MCRKDGLTDAGIDGRPKNIVRLPPTAGRHTRIEIRHIRSVTESSINLFCEKVSHLVAPVAAVRWVDVRPHVMQQLVEVVGKLVLQLQQHDGTFTSSSTTLVPCASITILVGQH